MKKIYTAIILLTILYSFSCAQISRTSAMGGLSFSIIDRNLSCNPYDFGGNPAYLVKDECSAYVEMNPYMQNSWGDYRKTFTPEGVSRMGAGFIGIKPLKTGGTFKGTAVYNYERRRNNYRTLRMDPYSGDAFLFADTTAFNHEYSGPTFELMHSLELFNDFYIGAAVNYEILEGLKKGYPYGETTFRNGGFNMGFTYMLASNFVAGVSYSFKDTQERIEAKDINNFTEIVYNYRGDKNKYLASPDYKINKDYHNVSGQLFWNNIPELEIGFVLNYGTSDSEILITKIIYEGDVKSSLDNYKDGYASFENISTNFLLRYHISENLMLAIKGGYDKTDSWSENCSYNTTLWEWDYSVLSTGVGLSYSTDSKEFTMGVEYELENINADSSKYVDNVYTKIDELVHIFKIGAEKQISNSFLFRAGFNYELLGYDPLGGTKNAKLYLFSVGWGYAISESIRLDFAVEYANRKADEVYNTEYSYWNSLINLKVFSF